MVDYLHGFGQLKITWAELDMLMLDDAPVSSGLVARVSTTKRKAPSWFSKRNTTKEEGLRFSRGSSLVVKIEREESLEKEQLKQRVWKEIAERKASQQMSGGVSSSIVDARPASRALPNNSGSSSAHQQLDGAIEEMQPSLLPKNVELHSQECKQHQSLDVHPIQRNDKENVDNCQQKMSVNELYVSKAHQLSEPTKQVHHLPRQGKSVVCDITTTQKAPPQDEVRKQSMDVASLSIPSIPQSVQNKHHQHHPQKVHQQSVSTKETGENFQRGEQEMMNCFASAPVVSTSQEVSDSLFGVTTVQVAKLKPHQEEEQQQLDFHGFKSSIENNGTTASDIDIGKERECASGGEQSKQDDQVQIRVRERKIEESKDDLYKIRMDADRMDEEMLVQYRALLDALPRPDAVASLPVQTQLSIIRQQADCNDTDGPARLCEFFRESRARIDIEYEEQLGRMQRLMASYLCNDIIMRANNKQVTSNDEEVAKK